MEKLTLIPQHQEIIVNNGSLDGAVDLFSYGPDTDQALRSLGALYVIGHRDTESNNISYIISLVAALARREYYAQPGIAPREAFGRMLRKVNEIVDEFFKSADVDVSVGIFAIAGSTILVSKLDKFKILLAREGQTIDILNNVALFTKEHVDKRRFSNIISGAVQPGDRILAYYPSKAITSRERYVKTYLTGLPADAFTAKLDEIGRQHPTFAAAMLCVNMVQSSEPATAPSIQPHELAPAPATYAWAPRQASTAVATTAPVETTEEIPQIISTEFSLGFRRNPLSKWLERIRFVRLDTRGKALFLGCAALVIIGGVLVTKSLLVRDPEAERVQSTLESIKSDLADSPTREILMRDLAAISGPEFQDNKTAKSLTASLVGAMDTLDNAQTGTLALVVQMDSKTDQLTLATWSSTSGSIWAITQDSDESLAAVQIQNGIPGSRVALTDIQPSIVLPFKTGVLIIDAAAKKIARIMDGEAKIFAIPTQDAMLSAMNFNDVIYLLTDHAILKITDLDTDKPVTKQWLTDTAELAPGASQIFIDGSIWTLGRDGMLTSYYKGKKAAQVQTTLAPSGRWQLLAGPDSSTLAVANSDTKRVYIIDTKTGALVRTIKVDTQQTLVQMLSGSDSSVLLISKDNKIWSVQ